MAYSALACRFAIGSAFAVSGISKVAGRPAFAEFVASLGTLARVPPRWRPPLAAVVVALELAVPVALATPAAVGALCSRPACWSRSARSCGRRCAAAPQPGAAASGPAARRRARPTWCATGCCSPSPWRAALLLSGPGGPVDPGGVAVAGAAGVVLAAVLVRLDDLISVFTPL